MSPGAVASPGGPHLRPFVLVFAIAFVSALVGASPLASAEADTDCAAKGVAVADEGCSVSAFQVWDGGVAFCSAGFLGPSQGSNVPALAYAGCGAGQGGAVTFAGCQAGERREEKTHRNVTWFECFPEARGEVSDATGQRNVTVATGDLDGDGAPDAAASEGCSTDERHLNGLPPGVPLDGNVTAIDHCRGSASALNGTFQFFDITYLAGKDPNAHAGAKAKNGTLPTPHGDPDFDLMAFVTNDFTNAGGDGYAALGGANATFGCKLDGGCAVGTRGEEGSAFRNSTTHFIVDATGPTLAFNGTVHGDPDFDLEIFVDGNGEQVAVEVLGAGCVIGPRPGAAVPLACIA